MYTKQTMMEVSMTFVSSPNTKLINFMIIAIIDILVLILYDFLLHSNLYLIFDILFMCVNDD